MNMNTVRQNVPRNPRGKVFGAVMMAAAIAVPVFGSGPAYASTSSGGTISTILVQGNVAFFNLSGPRSTVPGCAIVPGRWVFNISTLQGQAMLSALLTFYASGKTIGVVGTGACADWGDTESVQYLWVQN